MAQTRQPDEALFDALLTPHRSLSPRGFAILMAGVCAIGFGAGLVFTLAGAWPVVGFLGLDVVLVYVAFRVNYRLGACRETVRLTRRDLVVERVEPRGERRTWRFQPAWLQVLIDGPPAHGRRLVLRSHGTAIAIGDFLSMEERLDLAEALRRALAEARGAALSACAPCRPRTNGRERCI